MNLIEAMSRSTLGQVLLLYGLFTSRVKAKAQPLVQLADLIRTTFESDGLESRSATSCRILYSLLTCIDNLLRYVHSGKTMKSS